MSNFCRDRIRIGKDQRGRQVNPICVLMGFETHLFLSLAYYFSFALFCSRESDLLADCLPCNFDSDLCHSVNATYNLACVTRIGGNWLLCWLLISKIESFISWCVFSRCFWYAFFWKCVFFLYINLGIAWLFCVTKCILLGCYCCCWFLFTYFFKDFVF